MRRIVILAALAATAVPGFAAAQTWGQPQYYRPPATTYGQPYQPYGQSYGSAHGYARPDGRFGNPYAYVPPVRYDYGSGYVRPGEWTRWSSPPGRGYHDVYGYNDDRAPRGADNRRPRDGYEGVGAYLYDR